MKTLIPASISAPARPRAGAKGFLGMGPTGRWIFLGIVCLLTLWPVYFQHSWLWGALAADAIIIILILRDLALTDRALLLLLAGIVAAIPAFYHPNRIWLMLAWDACVLLLCAL